MREVRLTVRDITATNRRDKYIKAVTSLSKAMGLPLTIKPREKENTERFVYAAQEDLAWKWRIQAARALDSVYRNVCAALDMPQVSTFSKAFGGYDELATPVAEALWYRGTIVFNPETGKPIYKADFEKIIRTIERFLNKRLEPMGRKIVLNSLALGRVLARRLLNTPADELRKLRLADVKYQDKTIPWMAEELERQNRLFGPARPDERDRMAAHYRKIADTVEIAEQSMGEDITRMTDNARHAVKRAIIDGIKGRKTKREISQDLFNRMGNLNRDWGMIVEKETVDASNNAFLRETAAMAETGEKLYFKRIEMRDQYVCRFCENIRDTIALWVESPLADDAIDDPVASVAIWDGKDNVGRKSKDLWVASGAQHPWCRGSWVRYYPKSSAK